MKRFTPLFLAGVLGLSACADQSSTPVAAVPAGPARNAAAVPGEDFVAGQIIVRFTPGANRSEVAQAHRANKKDD
ncbi:MAG TPA: hypothetical protein VFS20_12910, partial [Longimicrobium sp.]|nr:hypothetical protein [Longimicrobium sp.]